jgi:glycine cleavage system H protein
MNFPADRKYTKDHEWAKIDGTKVTVGVTAFAIEQLGDITLVNVDAKVGDAVEAGKAFGTIESVKTLSDLFAPMSGKLIAINDALQNKPELVNEDCYDKGWMVVLEVQAGAGDALLDAKDYGDHVKSAAH